MQKGDACGKFVLQIFTFNTASNAYCIRGTDTRLPLLKMYPRPQMRHAAD